ncbi:MAG TPA: matrixin family metalloprotease [Vicinamibacterales bacterium]
MSPVLIAATLALTVAAAPQPVTRTQPRWPAGQVIRVSIDLQMAPAEAEPLVERAMSTWTNAADGRFKLERATSRNPATMRVRFVRGSGLYGESRPLADDRTGEIYSADVFITADVAGDLLDRSIVLYLTALHEIGHALGLPHNNDFSSIMYAFRLPGDGERYFGAYRSRVRFPDDIGKATATGLSDADVKTLKTLYLK